MVTVRVAAVLLERMMFVTIAVLEAGIAYGLPSDVPAVPAFKRVTVVAIMLGLLCKLEWLD